MDDEYYKDIKAKAQEYLSLELRSDFRQEVEELLAKDAKKDLADRFYRDLNFGTGGLRGRIGGGYNRMNSYTVSKASQGLANYVLQDASSNPHSSKHVVIAYDSRNYSYIFALEAAKVFCANGLKASIFESLRPTPQLSFTLRKLGATAGIVITASHNPAAYNGYKVYWSDGGQITAPHDSGIISEVQKVNLIKNMSQAEAEEQKLLQWLGAAEDKQYIDMIKGLVMQKELIARNASKIKIVYTPLHGAGRMQVERILNELSVPVFTVPEQAEPDGNFPTTEFPNPEIAPAMNLALRYGKERQADIVIGTDPDADRIGIGVPLDGDIVLISGNQLGAILLDYIIRAKLEQGNLAPKATFINTIVTSSLQNRIADNYKVKNYKVLTGFKYIGEMIKRFDNDPEHEYLFGCEESYGFLVGDEVRDKDAISAAMLIVEMALWNADRGLSIYEHLEEIFAKYGYYQEILIDRYFEGSAGAATMQGLMAKLRSKPPKKIGSVDITTVKDYLSSTTSELGTGKQSKDIDLPSSNVLQFIGTDGSIITARPSGTEPKIKFYASCRSENSDHSLSEEKIKAVRTAIEDIIAAEL